MIEFALSPLAAIFSHISAGIRQFMRLFFSSYRLIARNCAALVFLPLFPALASYMLSPLPCITIYYILYKCHSQAKVCYIALSICALYNMYKTKRYMCLMFVIYAVLTSCYMCLIIQSDKGKHPKTKKDRSPRSTKHKRERSTHRRSGIVIITSLRHKVKEDSNDSINRRKRRINHYQP